MYDVTVTPSIADAMTYLQELRNLFHSPFRRALSDALDAENRA